MKRAAFIVLTFIAGFLAMMCALILGAHLKKPAQLTAADLIAQCLPPEQPGPHKPSRALSMPLPLHIVVVQSGPGIANPRPVYYFPPSQR